MRPAYDNFNYDYYFKFNPARPTKSKWKVCIAHNKDSVLCCLWSGSGHIIQGHIVYELHHKRDACMLQGTLSGDTSFGVTMSCMAENRRETMWKIFIEFKIDN
jgi:hypothetical protein